MSPSQTLRNTAAQIAAAALFESFPSVQIWRAAPVSQGFVCDCYFPHSIHPQLRFQIEEKMRQIVREKREIRDLEMVPFSARELLKSQGHKSSLSGEGLVGVVQIGSFSNLSEGKNVKNTAELAAFQLLSVEPLEERGLRLIGAAYPSKEELKAFLKKWALYPKVRHEVVGEKELLWRIWDGQFLWLPRGLRLREALLRLLKKNLFEGAYEVALPPGASQGEMRRHLLREKSPGPIAEVLFVENDPGEGLFIPPQGTEILLTASREKLISSLQSIGKTLSILGFSYCSCLVGPKRKRSSYRALAEALEQLQQPYEEGDEEEEKTPQIQFLVADGLGRMWRAATVQAEPFVVCQLNVERNLALLLEQSQLKNSTWEERIKRLENQ